MPVILVAEIGEGVQSPRVALTNQAKNSSLQTKTRRSAGQRKDPGMKTKKSIYNAQDSRPKWSA